MLLNPYRFILASSVNYPTYVGSGGLVGSTADITNVYWPAGHANGDLGILIVETANQTTPTPSGWTPIPGGTAGLGTPGAYGAHGINMFYRYATSAGMGAVTVPHSGEHQTVHLLVFRGAHSLNPFDAVASSTDASASRTRTMPAITTTSEKCLVLLVSGSDYDGYMTNQFSSWKNTDLTEITELTNLLSPAGTGGGCGTAIGKKTMPGPVGVSTVTAAIGAAGTGFSLAIAPVQP